MKMSHAYENLGNSEVWLHMYRVHYYNQTNLDQNYSHKLIFVRKYYCTDS